MPVHRVSPIGQVEHDHAQMEEYRRRHAEEISLGQPDSLNRMGFGQDGSMVKGVSLLRKNNSIGSRIVYEKSL